MNIVLNDTVGVLNVSGLGYIAGSGDGIVTIQSKPKSRPIFLYESKGGTRPPKLLAQQASLANGRYLFRGLDVNKKYLVMARDHKEQYEPVAWDFVSPATDLTLVEQQALWTSWQTN